MSESDDLQQIALQEKTLVFLDFDNDAAWRLGIRLRFLAVERHLPVVIDVRRFHHPLFYCALPGTTPDNADWVRRKSNSCARFHRSSYATGLKLKLEKITLADKYALSTNDYSVHGGSFPLILKNAGPVGSATVSGLPQRADHELVVEAICLELNLSYDSLKLSSPSPAT
jgi:uncharacterized protein (UPF0303 family)